VVVGTYIVPGSSSGTVVAHGFSLSADGQYTTVDAPTSTGAFDTGANATNDAGDILGLYSTVAITINDLLSDSFIFPGHGFLSNSNNGTFTIIDVSLPGVTVLGQNVLGVNARGDIVGVYLDGSFAEHGFLATR